SRCRMPRICSAPSAGLKTGAGGAAGFSGFSGLIGLGARPRSEMSSGLNPPPNRRAKKQRNANEMRDKLKVSPKFQDNRMRTTHVTDADYARSPRTPPG